MKVIETEWKRQIPTATEKKKLFQDKISLTFYVGILV